MEIAVKDLSTGRVYTNNMGTPVGIVEIHFCTSYTQVVVQDELEIDGETKYPTHDIILPPLGSEPYWVDLIATQNDPVGEWVEPN